MARLPPLGLAVFHLYDSPDSPMTLRSDTVLRLPERSATARAADPLPVRSQQADSQTFYISSQSLTLGFSGTTGLLEVGFLSPCTFLDSWFEGFACLLFTLITGEKPVSSIFLIKANMACLLVQNCPFICFLLHFSPCLVICVLFFRVSSVEMILWK